ncbi:hypothetical protein TcasGA2_TC013797 [Tribolium castaneum]|uniref:Uncharacterized protein n=1 Tax=Tribolium castaneum TaxID=7070 RepID=D6WJ42_TRICA|nr:hypothetical protein TcasGA2_TC013797 [Tribolium castaneum]
MVARARKKIDSDVLSVVVRKDGTPKVDFIWVRRIDLDAQYDDGRILRNDHVLDTRPLFTKQCRINDAPTPIFA